MWLALTSSSYFSAVFQAVDKCLCQEWFGPLTTVSRVFGALDLQRENISPDNPELYLHLKRNLCWFWSSPSTVKAICIMQQAQCYWGSWITVCLQTALSYYRSFESQISLTCINHGCRPFIRATCPCSWSACGHCLKAAASVGGNLLFI